MLVGRASLRQRCVACSAGCETAEQGTLSGLVRAGANTFKHDCAVDRALPCSLCGQTLPLRPLVRPTIFAERLAGDPVQLFEACYRTQRLRTAACYLIIMQASPCEIYIYQRTSQPELGNLALAVLHCRCHCRMPSHEVPGPGPMRESVSASASTAHSVKDLLRPEPQGRGQGEGGPDLLTSPHACRACRRTEAPPGAASGPRTPRPSSCCARLCELPGRTRYAKHAKGSQVCWVDGGHQQARSLRDQGISDQGGASTVPAPGPTPRVRSPPFSALLTQARA